MYIENKIILVSLSKGAMGGEIEKENVSELKILKYMNII
jgi:hypothetical protein